MFKYNGELNCKTLFKCNGELQLINLFKLVNWDERVL